MTGSPKSRSPGSAVGLAPRTAARARVRGSAFPGGRRRVLVVVATLGACLSGGPAWPWTGTLMEALSRDARRLVPRTLASLLSEREEEVFEEVRRFPASLSQALAGDLARGRLSPATLSAMEARTQEAIASFRARRLSEGVVRLGGLLRIPADLSDPVLSAGSAGLPAGVAREYYAFVEASLSRMPVVLSDRAALSLARGELPGYWESLQVRSREASPVIRTELFRDGRLLDHRRIDFRNPVFGVASLAYSRAVTAIAATWLAVWREVRGDLTRMPEPHTVRPGPGGAGAGEPPNPRRQS